MKKTIETLDKAIKKLNSLTSYESVINEIYEGTRQPKRVTEIDCNMAEFQYEIEIITGKVIQVYGEVKFDCDGLFCDIEQILKEDGFGDYLNLPDHLLEAVRKLIHDKVYAKVGKDLEYEYFLAHEYDNESIFFEPNWFSNGMKKYEDEY
jgi:hypothetical protein